MARLVSVTFQASISPETRSTARSIEERQELCRLHKVRIEDVNGLLGEAAILRGLEGGSVGKGISVLFDNDDPCYRGDSRFEVGRVPRVLPDSLREFLLRQGISCSQLSEHSFYGWSMDVRVFGRLFLVVVQDGWDIDIGQIGSLNFVWAKKPFAESLNWLCQKILFWIETEVPGSVNDRTKNTYVPPSL